MAKSRLSKLLSQDRVHELVESIANAMHMRVHITEADGTPLWGDILEGERCAIRVSGNVVGWVISHAQPRTIGRALEIMAADDMEKRELAREGVQKYRELALLYDVSEKISSCLRVADIVRFMSEEVRNVVKIGEPLLLLRGQDGAGLVDPLHEGPWATPVMQSCHRFIEGVIGQAKPEIVNNPREDPRFEGGRDELPALMAVPLIVKGNTLGALVVLADSPDDFRSEDLHLLAGLGTLCAAAIEKARLYENIETESRLRANFQRYLSPTIVDDIVANRTEISLGGKSIECSILFSDICGFTSMAERQTPEATVQFLNEYFSAMSDIVFRYGGTLDKFIGDAVMAVFGAPFPLDAAHYVAILVALEMHQTLHRLRWKWEREGRPQVRHRIGISTGRVIAGNIGSDKRMDYTVIGDPVNVASRMETLSPAMGTFISEETYEKVRDDLIALPMMPVRVKGKETPVTIYSVLGIRRKREPNATWFAALPVELLQDGSAEAIQGVMVGISGHELTVHTPSPLVKGALLQLRGVLAPEEPETISVYARVADQEAIADAPVYFCNRLSIESRKQDQTDFACAAFLRGLSDRSHLRMEAYAGKDPDR